MPKMARPHRIMMIREAQRFPFLATMRAKISVTGMLAQPPMVLTDMIWA